jgi:hypothetical protein
MIDIKNPNCQEEDCKKHPSYNYENKSKGIYCVSHKKEGMIDVKSPNCQEEGCKLRPAYNYDGEKNAMYCVSHKKEGMVNVISPTCQEEGCKKQPAYNYEDQTKGIYCVSHKKEGMVNVKSNTCQEEGCKKQSVYNYENKSKGVFCNTHKKDRMINVKSPICKSDLCPTFISKKYDGYCLFCFMNLFPDKPTSRNYKTKEYSVVDYIKTKYPDFTWRSDKIIQGGCSKRRPDLFLDLGYQVIIIEIDENQHTDYDCSCENKRIMELSQDVNHRSIIFIRFNPDDYNKNGELVSSCWGVNGKGLCVIKKNKKEEWKNRLQVLEEQIKYWTDPSNVTNKTVEIIQLFYDN